MKDTEEDINTGLSEMDFESDVLSETKKHTLTRKTKNVLNNAGTPELLNNVKALSNYLLDKNVKWYRKSLVVVTITYFVKPKDALANWNEFFGFLEDIGAIEKAVGFLGKEIEEYY